MAIAGLAALVFVSRGKAAETAATRPAYSAELGIVYESVDGKELTLNAFLPSRAAKPGPAMLEIHGGWWTGGNAGNTLKQMPAWPLLVKYNVAIFSVKYRLGAEGGFPACIRDCRNAVRFIRKNADRFNIDPSRIGCTGGSAGGHLSLMVAMVPEDFPDGGPTDDLKGVSARVCNAFSWIPPTDLLEHWNQGPPDESVGADGKTVLRPLNPKVPNDSRGHYRLLFKGIAPDTAAHKQLYLDMSPIGHARKDVPPLLICDGENDPIVPGLEGKTLYEKLQTLGADATYWMTPRGGHAFPNGKGFNELLEKFLVRTLKPDAKGAE